MNPRVRWAKVLLLCVAVVGLAGCRVLTQAEYDRLTETEELARRWESTNIALTREMDNLEERYERARQDVESLREELADARRRVEQTERQMRERDELAKAAVESAQVLSRQLDDLRERNKQMADQLARGRDVGEGVETIYGAEGYGFRLPGAMLFASGEAELRSGAKSTLDKVVEELQKTDERIRVAGYTDSDPISATAAIWDSNFHLSGARALAVLNYLAEQGIPRDRMHFAGYGEYALIRDPDGTENKEKSRRAEIWLLTDSPAVGETTRR